LIHVCARAPRVRERACVVTVPEYKDPPLGPAPREGGVTGGRERERERGRERDYCLSIFLFLKLSWFLYIDKSYKNVF